MEPHPQRPEDGGRHPHRLSTSAEERSTALHGFYSRPINSALSNQREILEPEWSPDSAKLVYTRRTGITTYELFTINADGTGDVKLTHSSAPGFDAWSDTLATWSPDGSRIAFTRLQIAEVGNYYVIPPSIFTISPDGTNEVRVTNGSVITAGLDWARAPDQTAPATTIALAPSTPTGTNGWYRGAVTATVSATDAGSGVAETRCALDSAAVSFAALPASCAYGGAGQSVAAEGVHTLYAASSDAAGNVEAVTSTGFKIDSTAPTLAFAGNGTYTVDQAVNVTCAAADPALALGPGPASGMTANPCASSVSTGPAYTFALGANTAGPVTATDQAGNATTKSTTFTVNVTPTSLCRLTTQFVQGSSRYGAFKTAQKTAVDKLAAAACQNLDGLVAGLTAAKKAALVKAYKLAVDGLAAPSQGWLTTTQADKLKLLAAGL